MPVPPPAVASAADAEAWLASPHVSARVRAKVAKVEAEGPAVAAQHERLRATGELPAEQAAAVAEEMLDGIGVLGCVVAELKARKTAGVGSFLGKLHEPLDAAFFGAADEAALAHDDAALVAALCKFRALGLVVPPALAAATADQARALPLAATDPAAAAVHRRRKEAPGALPGTPSLQRVVGGLLVLADAAPDGPAKLAPNARLVDELLPLHEERRATATEATVAAVLADVKAHGAEAAAQTAVPGAADAVKQMDAAVAARIPQTVVLDDGGDGGPVPATDDVADELALLDDPEARDPERPGLALCLRSVGVRGSVVLHLLVCMVAAGVGRGAEVLPGGLKGLRRVTFKSALNCCCRFARRRDGTRATIVASTLLEALWMLLALLDAEGLVLLRAKNRFTPGNDPVPLGGCQDLQLLCLFRVGGRWRRCEVQLNLRRMQAVKAREDGGHATFDFGRSILAFTPSVCAHEGVIAERLTRQVAAGMVLSVAVCRLSTTTVNDQAPLGQAAKSAFYAALGAAAYRVRTVDLTRTDIGAAECAHLGPAIAASASLTSINLAQNNVGDAGCAHLGPAIAASASLASVDLSWNGISTAAKAKLGPAIAASVSLASINLKGNDIGAAAKAKLKKICRGKGIKLDI